MGLNSALSTAVSGLRVVEDGISVVSNNVANVDSPGYTKKTAVQAASVTGDQSLGVRSTGVRRQTSDFVLSEIRNETTNYGYASTIDRYYSQLDGLFGSPGGAGSLDTLYNEFVAGLQSLSTTPDSGAIRIDVINDATVLAGRLNSMSGTIQAMRQDAEQQLSDDIRVVNDLLQDLERTNSQIINGSAGGFVSPDLLDQRDLTINELSEYLDINVVDRENDGVAVFTSSGTLLFDRESSTLDFDRRANISARSTYNPEDGNNALGSITITTANGFTIDLIEDGSVEGGKLGALLDMRDDILVGAQRQLDEFAASLSKSLSDVQVAGTAVSVPAGDGFSLDLSSLLPGDIATVDVTVGGVPQTFSFIRADDATGFPLSNDLTPRTDDTVIGLDFTGASGTLAAQIQAALGADFTATDLGGNQVQILDDGAVGNSNVTAASAAYTATTTTGNGTALAVFTDRFSASGFYTGDVDGNEQLTGYAQRIAVNEALKGDPAALVIYDAASATGDSSRPDDLIARLDASNQVFSGQTGMSAGNALTTSVGNFLQDVVIFQTGEANLAAGNADIVRDTLVALEERYIQDTGVNSDEEMARLIELQNAYAANARIISAVDEMIQRLLEIG